MNFHFEKNNMEQKGKAGKSATAYLVEDEEGNEFILKKSNDSNPEVQKEWFRKIIEAFSMYQDLFDNFDGKVKISKLLGIDEDYVVEENLGKDFDKEVYDNLPESTKKDLAKDYARFLLYMHSIQAPNLPNRGKQINAINSGFSNELIYDYFANLLTEDDKKMLNSIINPEQNNEIIVPIHGDLRAQNVLYNEKTNSLGIIDFETFGIGNIYNDFVPSAAGSFGMSYDFLFDTVDEYNNIAPDKLKVQKNLVKTYMQLGILNEYGRVSILLLPEVDENINEWIQEIRSKGLSREKSTELLGERITQVLKGKSADNSKLSNIEVMMSKMREVEEAFSRNIIKNQNTEKSYDFNVSLDRHEQTLTKENIVTIAKKEEVVMEKENATNMVKQLLMEKTREQDTPFRE